MKCNQESDARVRMLFVATAKISASKMIYSCHAKHIEHDLHHLVDCMNEKVRLLDVVQRMYGQDGRAHLFLILK